MVKDAKKRSAKPAKAPPVRGKPRVMEPEALEKTSATLHKIGKDFQMHLERWSARAARKYDVSPDVVSIAVSRALMQQAVEVAIERNKERRE